MVSELIAIAGLCGGPLVPYLVKCRRALCLPDHLCCADTDFTVTGLHFWCYKIQTFSLLRGYLHGQSEKIFLCRKVLQHEETKVKKLEPYHSVSKYPPDKTRAAGDHPYDDQSCHKGSSFSFDLLPLALSSTCTLCKYPSNA